MAMLRLLARESDGVTLVPPIVVRDELESGALVEHCRVPEHRRAVLRDHRASADFPIRCSRSCWGVRRCRRDCAMFRPSSRPREKRGGKPSLSFRLRGSRAASAAVASQAKPSRARALRLFSHAARETSGRRAARAPPRCDGARTGLLPPSARRLPNFGRPISHRRCLRRARSRAKHASGTPMGERHAETARPFQPRAHARAGRGARARGQAGRVADRQFRLSAVPALPIRATT